MNDTLKVAGRIGAELGAAKAEVERLRGEIARAVREFDECDAFNAEGRAVELMEELRAALSQQPEPTDTYTAVDMATAAAHGFRDGQAAVEPAPAQDERECVTGGTVSELLAAIMHFGSEKWAEGRGAADPELANVRAAWDSVYSLVQDLATRPAQTEQQPVAVPEGWKLVPVQPTAEMLAAVTTSTFEPLRQEAMKMAREDYQAMLYAAPIAQTEQQPAYVECRECTDCGHVGINDAHPKDATCAMCDWSGPSPVEDQCPDCGKENAMGAACPKCSGRYRILAETHVAAPIAQTAPQGTTSDTLIKSAKALLALDEKGSLAPHGIGGLAREVIEKLIARVEQTAPQGKFRMGDLVKKSTGSEWVGRVVGWYSTEQTPEGYAVESAAHKGSVQIYPAKALEAVE